MSDLTGLIVDMPDGGFTNGGQLIFANLILQAGEKLSLSIEHEKLGQFVLGWMRFGESALAERRKFGSHGHEASYSYRAQAVNVAITSDRTSLTFRMVIGPASQIDFQVPLDIVEQLIHAIPTALAHVKSASPAETPKKH
jgi:hypothetical protein